jgi:hypothetical protein
MGKVMVNPTIRISPESKRPGIRIAPDTRDAPVIVLCPPSVADKVVRRLRAERKRTA